MLSVSAALLGSHFEELTPELSEKKKQANENSSKLTRRQNVGFGGRVSSRKLLRDQLEVLPIIRQSHGSKQMMRRAVRNVKA